jgi:hypothetical protein
MSVSKPTIVTAAFDLGRDSLAAAFRRPPDHYVRHLQATLAIDCPMVVYTQEAFVDFICATRGERDTRIVVLEGDAFAGFGHAPQIDAIRGEAQWRGQAAWLAESPQASLPGYNALVMSKLLWLQEQAQDNPFGSEHLYWLDGALSHTVDPSLLDASSLVRLSQRHQRFLLVCFPYEGSSEVHGFDSDSLARLAGVSHTRWVARGGLFGGARDQVDTVATAYGLALQQTLDAGLMGTEESLLTLLSYQRPEWFDLQFVAGDGLLWPFFAELASGCKGDVAGAAAMLPALAETWFVSFNASQQWEALLQSLAHVAPELLGTADKVLVNNSTDASMFAHYDQLCAQYGIRQLRMGNLGINGARQLGAEQFYAGGRHAMFWFEDDMLLLGDEGRGHTCTNGFVRHIPGPGAACLAVAQREGADYVKFSFTEVYGSHHTQWGWHNLGDEGRARHFPGLIDPPRAAFTAIDSLAGVPYALGEVYYSNWPHVITRRGTKALFLDQRYTQSYEQFWTARSFELLRAGQLTAAVLLAAPVNHCRTQDYTRDERRE